MNTLAAVPLELETTMDVNLIRDDGVLTATVAGRIDSSNAHTFAEQITGAITDDDSAYVMDLAGLVYISSAGLRAVLMAAKTCRARKIKFVLCALADPVLNVFQVSGFDRIVGIHSTRVEAVAAVSN